MLTVDDDFIRNNPPQMPGHLDPAACEVWNQLVPTLLEHGVGVCALDNPILAVYCETVALYRIWTPGVKPKNILKLRKLREALLMTSRRHQKPVDPFEWL